MPCIELLFFKIGRLIIQVEKLNGYGIEIIFHKWICNGDDIFLQSNILLGPFPRGVQSVIQK